MCRNYSLLLMILFVAYLGSTTASLMVLLHNNYKIPAGGAQ